MIKSLECNKTDYKSQYEIDIDKNIENIRNSLGTCYLDNITAKVLQDITPNSNITLWLHEGNSYYPIHDNDQLLLEKLKDVKW